jgi:hypothetical protein
MRQIEKTRKFEKALVLFLNTFDDWKLEWNGDGNLPYDASGFTPKGNKCVIGFLPSLFSFFVASFN